ncbi:MAG: CRISPR-associated endonuclease Cas1 [Myxococcota bacterium]
MKTSLYLATEDVRLRLRGESIVVEHLEPGGSREWRKASSTERFPMANLDAVVLSARTGVTGPLLGRLCARVEPHPSRNALVRRAQVHASLDESHALAIGRTIIRAKIRNQRVFLSRHLRRGVTLDPAIERRLRDSEDRVKDAATRSEIMGHEGNAARTYFEGLRELLTGSGFDFGGRSRRPPTDPVNALLSYGYALLAADCADAAAIAGFDPYIGFLHTERWGRAELALDLMEELRTPLVDSLVCGAIRRRVFAVEGFSRCPEGGVRMEQKTRRSFLKLWAQQKHRTVVHPVVEARHPLAKLPLLQARLLGKHLLGQTATYTPFVWR